MPADLTVEKELQHYADAHREDLVKILTTLVRTRSENTPPVGAEGDCQRYCEGLLKEAGFETDLYELDTVAGLKEHPLYFAGRDYRGRPNLAGKKKGSGGGRSLVLTGHVDTVPKGTLDWTRDPFGAEIEDGRLYGRGSNDMKAGIAANVWVGRALAEMGIALKGDLTVESVVDEEFGGVNGTLAGRLRGYLADAAVVSEPSFLRICPAQRGGRTAHLKLKVPNAGILAGGMDAGVSLQLAWLLSQIPAFAERRTKAAPRHYAYAGLENPVPVAVLKIHTGPWGTQEPMATAHECMVELYWQALPGERLEDVDAQFFEWLKETVEARRELFPVAPEVSFPLRWLPGSSCAADAAVLREMAASAREVLGRDAEVAGIEGPCDMYVFQQHFGMPAVIWGVRGGNTHLADEYVELDTLYSAAKALLLFTYRWCMQE